MNKLSGNINTDALLKVVAAKLNMDPLVLKKQLEEGRFDEAIRNMSPKDAAKFQQALKNPSAADKMMSSDKARELYSRITGNGKTGK